MDLKEAMRLVAWLRDPTMTDLDRRSTIRLVEYLMASTDSSFLEAVKRFNYSNPHRELPQTVGFGTQREIELARKLIREETREFFDAIDERNFVKAVDGAMDLQYVVLNAICGALGMHHNAAYERCFTEVHRSNMTKVFPDGTVHQREDGKILKPDSFVAPEPALRKILVECGWQE